MAYGVYCLLCGYTLFSNSLFKILRKIVVHYAISHSKTHKGFTIIGTNKIQKTIDNFYDNYEISGKLLKKLRVGKPPYIHYISIEYHKHNKHVIFILIEVDDFDYLLMKHSKIKPHNLVIL